MGFTGAKSWICPAGIHLYIYLCIQWEKLNTVKNAYKAYFRYTYIKRDIHNLYACKGSKPWLSGVASTMFACMSIHVERVIGTVRYSCGKSDGETMDACGHVFSNTYPSWTLIICLNAVKHRWKLWNTLLYLQGQQMFKINFLLCSPPGIPCILFAHVRSNTSSQTTHKNRKCQSMNIFWTWCIQQTFFATCVDSW